MTPEHRAKIGAARRARGVAFRSSAVNGCTLADLHAAGVYFADAAKRMGWSESVVKNWERDTGLRFQRIPQAERNRRQSEDLLASGKAAERAASITTPEMVAANHARMRAIWADPERRAEMIAKRVAARRANPEAAEQSRAQLRAVEDKRAVAIRALFADPARWGAVKAKLSAAALARNADPAFRAAMGAQVRETKRRARVQKGLAALDAGRLTEAAARRLIRDMTADERIAWAMARDAQDCNRRLREQAQAHTEDAA